MLKYLKGSKVIVEDLKLKAKIFLEAITNLVTHPVENQAKKGKIL